MYPTYELQVYAYLQDKWVQAAGTEISNRPHHYDVLHKIYARLVSNATEGASLNQKPIGYRIRNEYGSVYDCWTNGKV